MPVRGCMAELVLLLLGEPGGSGNQNPGAFGDLVPRASPVRGASIRVGNSLAVPLRLLAENP